MDPFEYLQQENPSELYLGWDPHFTEAGHEAYGRFLYEQIKPLLKAGRQAIPPTYALGEEGSDADLVQ